jgi:predicted AAA+ superfamily ATPase
MKRRKFQIYGLNLKLIVDTIPYVSVLISGSSSLDLREKVGEPLVGRSQYFFFILYLYLK